MDTERERLARWVAEGLAKKGKTQTGLANAMGVSQPRISEILAGKRQIKAEEIPKISRYLEIVPLPETASLPLRKVNVVGYVGAGNQVFPMDDLPLGGSHIEGGVDGPPGATSETVAVIVRGNSMWPVYNDGDLIFYHDRRDGDVSDLVGRECVVCLVDGSMYIKRLQRGATPGTYTLISFNAPPIENAQVAWAARVRWIERR